MGERYHEMVIEGPRGRLHGFIEGYLGGRGIDKPVIDAEREGINCQPFLERISDLLHPTSEVLHLLVPEDVAPVLRKALEKEAPPDLHAVIKAERVIVGARFAFSFAIYSREHAARVKERFTQLPEGVRLTPDTHFEEKEHPASSGVEVYAPVHDFSFTGKGTVTGDVEGVLELFQFCRDEDLIEHRPAELIEEESGG